MSVLPLTSQQEVSVPSFAPLCGRRAVRDASENAEDDP